jgi:hypothetical protein
MIVPIEPDAGEKDEMLNGGDTEAVAVEGALVTPPEVSSVSETV